MPAMWKGSIGFGLVSIPISLEAATGDHDIHFHQVHVRDGGRIRQKRICEAGGHEVEYRDLAKGYQAPDGRQAVLTDEDLEDELPLPSKRLIDVLAFVDLHELDAVQYARAYYAVPQAQQNHKAYVLLRETMEAEGKAAIAKVAIGTRESLAVLRPRGDLMVLHTMHWPDEVREPPVVAPDESSRPQELKMIRSLMDRMGEGYDLGAEEDARQAALKALVEAKLEGREPEHGRPEEPETEDVVDLMAALEASLGTGEEPVGKAKKRRTG